ncbi:MAG: thiamine pyrophosphate-binding protein [Acidimicrobiia bacterium]|nr:thiamine pyrophosphate-binding protein [Acidimicrobiia bacterium]
MTTNTVIPPPATEYGAVISIWEEEDVSDASWFKVGPIDVLGLNEVTVVQAGHHTIALSRTEAGWGAVGNRCPHQGGPLGEGLIEGEWLTCPWHGWEYNPTTGEVPGGFDDGVPAYAVEERDDGIYIRVEEPQAHDATFMTQLVDRLVEGGVEVVFGMVGHSNLGFADALRAAEQQGDLRYVGIRHEGAAAFAASSYGKLTGKPAVAFAIAGPGATNLYTGMWDAKLSTTPLLAITGQIPTRQLGTRAFQEVPLTEALGPVAGWSKRLSASDTPRVATDMVHYAVTQRDVAHLVLPDDVQTLPPVDDHEPGPQAAPNALPLTPADVQAIAALIDGSEHPLFVVGRGGAPHGEAIVELAEHVDAAVVTTFPAKGCIPETHHLSTGVLGRSGTPVSAAMQTKSDLIVVFGGGMAPHTGITPKRPVVRIDTDHLAARRNTPNVEVFALADAGEAANALVKATAARSRPELREWIALRKQWWRERKASRRGLDVDGRLTNAAVFGALEAEIPSDAVVALDVGNTTYSFGRYFEASGQRIAMSGWLGSIGYALPGAIGAAMAFPDRTVVAIAGDGGFGQYAMELATVAKYGLEVKVLVLRNDELGKITAEQQLADTHVWSTSLVNPSFAGMAKTLGMFGRSVATVEELTKGMADLFAHDGPGLLEIQSSRLQY